MISRRKPANRPTLGQFRWLALFFALFFAASSTLQYCFIHAEIRKTAFRNLALQADQINDEIDYKGSIDLEKINKASFDAGRFIVIQDDGMVLDMEPDSKGLIPGLIPPVRCPAISKAVFQTPFTFDINGQEKWRILAKRVKGGTVILGFSFFDNVASVDERLQANMKYFGMTVEEAKHVSPSKPDNDSHWAVIDDSGQLLSVSGRIPLKIDPNQAEELIAKGPLEQKQVSGNTYMVAYKPLLETGTSKRVGVIIVYQDITRELAVLRHQLSFGIGVAVISFAVFCLLYGYYSSRHEKEKRMIREAFQNYFSPQIMEAILREPERLRLGGEHREVTILFSDIRSFTSLAEKLPPEQLTRLLHEYFTEMTEEVIATDGIVDKYIGDAIMAFWGAPIDQPDQADRAVKAAVNMVKRLKKLREKWAADGLPVLDIGIGINLGIATVGNMGSAKRFDYTLIGDAVNSASRIEGLNKKFASRIIISESTKSKLTIPVQLKDLGETPIPGRQVPIRVYEVKVSEDSSAN